jgi:hypothetical protein
VTTHKIENTTFPAVVTRAVRAVLRGAGVMESVVKAATTEGAVADDGRATWLTEVDMVHSGRDVPAAVEALQAAYPAATVRAVPFANIMIVRMVHPRDAVDEPAPVDRIAEPGSMAWIHGSPPVEPDLIDEPADDSFLTADELAADRAGQYRGRVEDERLHNGPLWAGMIMVARNAGITENPARETVARQLAAVIMRAKHPEWTVYAPGDALPEPPPALLFDLDGYQHEHDDEAGHGTYRMTEGSLAGLDPAEYGGVRVWPFLLAAEGPFVDAATVTTTATPEV